MARKLIRSELTDEILGCAIAVHKALGPGFLEKFYEEALCIELALKGLKFRRQMAVALVYREQNIGCHRLDLLVENCVIVELKATKKLEDIHYATTLSYLKATKAEVALLLNFNSPMLSIKRFANSILRLNTESLNNGNTEEIVKFLRENDRTESVP